VVIEVQNLTFQYRSPFSPIRTALSDISLRIESKEIMAIVGATGSGKTTLIQHFNGLHQPTTGRILVDSKDLSASKSHLAWARRMVGLVFQFPEIQLFEETVYDDIAFGPRNLNLSEKEVDERVRSSLKLVGMDFEHFRKLSPFHLSGGEKRRIAIAGVLAMDPHILVLDEPTVGLDHRAASLVEDVILSYHRQGKTIVFVSHDMDLVARLAERVIILNRGRVSFDGLKEDLFVNEEILKQSGLILPQVCRFMLKIKERGYPVRTDVFTVEDAERELEKIVGKKSR
jgi:energy-coupling factor transport system ATP-binding protein